MITPDSGSVGFPARLVGGRRAASSLRLGSVITLRTEVSTLSGRLEFFGSDIRLAPVSSVGIPPGKTVRLLVVSTIPQLRLQLLSDYSSFDPSAGDSSRSALRHALIGLRLQHADHAEDVVRALMNSHRELSPELIRMLSTRIGRDLPDRLRHRRARVLVELADREMFFEEEGSRSGGLIPFLADGRWGSGGRGDQQRSGDENHDHRETTDLRTFLSRSTRTPSHGLQLFNHLRSSGDLHWVVIPIGAHQGDSTTTGTLRVGIDQTDHSPREATLALEVGEGVWWFSWKIRNDGARLVSYEAETDAPEIPESLLARIDGRGHTGVNQTHYGDGFSATSSGIDRLGVDEYG